MNQEKYDKFLDDATHAVAELWAKLEDPLDADQLLDLNDDLDAFFDGLGGED